jgi:hypothetical protein
MRQEPRGVQTEAVIARTPRNGRCRCTIDDERLDAVPMQEFACDGEAGWSRADDDDVGMSSGHRDPSRNDVNAVRTPSTNRSACRTGASWSTALGIGVSESAT